MPKRFLLWLVLFFALFLTLEGINPKKEVPVSTGDFVISPLSAKFVLGDSARLRVDPARRYRRRVREIFWQLASALL